MKWFTRFWYHDTIDEMQRKMLDHVHGARMRTVGYGMPMQQSEWFWRENQQLPDPYVWMILENAW